VIDLPKFLRSHVRLIAVIVGSLALIIWVTVAPKIVEVDVAEVRRGAMEVTVDEDGITRYRDIYKVTAPLAGEMKRIAWESGDSVKRGEVLATILSVRSTLLDPRTRQESEARVEAARAAVTRAAAEVKVAVEEMDKSKRYVERDERRLNEGLISAPVLEDSRQALKLAESSREAAVAAQKMAEFDVRVAEAALKSGSGGEGASDFHLTSPINGLIINVPEESGRILAPGETILEIGDPSSLEVRVDILSQDAVQVKPGQRVRIEHWGGDSVLEGTVNRVEPSAYTKVSALGVDEQRVWVTIALATGTGTPLGHGYRVEVRIVVWAEDDVLLAPAGAVFRSGTGWGAYRINREGRTEFVEIEIGKRNPSLVEVRGGVTAGDRLVMHPGDRVGKGTKVRVR